MLVAVAPQLAVGASARLRAAAQLPLALGELPRARRAATAGIHPPWFHSSSPKRRAALLSADFVIKYSWLSALACRVLIEFCIFRRD